MERYDTAAHLVGVEEDRAAAVVQARRRPSGGWSRSRMRVISPAGPQAAEIIDALLTLWEQTQRRLNQRQQQSATVQPRRPAHGP